MSDSANSDDRRPWPDEIEAILAKAGSSDPGSSDPESSGIERTGTGSSGLEPSQQRGSGFAAGADRWNVDSATVYRFADAETVDPEAVDSETADSVDPGPNSGSAGLSRFVDAIAALNRSLEETAPGGTAPFVVAPVLGFHAQWLVTAKPDGQPGHRPELHADPDDLVTGIGRGLAKLHDLAPPPSALAELNGGGEAADSDVVVERCAAAVEAGMIDRATLPHPYDRYRPDELLAMFIEGRSVLASADEPDVWCHGDAVAERFMVHAGSFTGFDRMERPIVANRHLDLASMHLSVQLHFGPEAVFRFYEAYGQDPSLALLEHHILGAHLMAGPQS